MEGKVQRFSMYLLPPQVRLPLYQCPPADDTFVTADEPTLMHHNHPESIVYIRVHSWCAFCEFGQMYDDTYAP